MSGQNLSIYAVSPQPKHGDVDVVLLQTGGSGNPYVYAVKYTPDADFTGTDTFTIEINYQGAYPYLIYRGYRVSVYPSQLTARSDFALTSTGSAVTANVLLNDNSPNGPLTLSAIPQVKNGTAQFSGDSSIQFTPSPGFTGVGYVQYVVCDAAGGCQTAQLSIGVSNNPPTSDTIRIATARNTPVTIPLTHAGYAQYLAPSNGTLSLPGGYSFRYSPNANFTGADQFKLATNAYGATVYKTVLVEVLNTPNQNTMAIDDRAYTPKGTPVSLNVRQNDIGNLLVKSWVVPPNFPGTISNTNGIGNVTFTPNPNFTGVATFYYKIGNMFVPDLEMAAVQIFVGNLNPSAGTFELTTPKETPMVINYKIPFSGFTFSVVDPPGHGSVVFYPGTSTQTINGQVVTGTNLLVYTPDNNYTGIDEFEISYCVTANGQCQLAKIDVNVVPVSSAPPPYCVGECVWTGDVNADGVVNNKDILPLGYYMGIDGPTRANASLEWYGQHSASWNNPFVSKGADLKHADTDGNGRIDTNDTLAVSLFYHQHHQLTPNIPASSKGLPFFLNILTPNPGIGDLVEVEVSLGNSNLPLTNLYGFTFDFSLSPQIIDSALQMAYYQGSWMNRNAADIWLSKNPRPGRLESAFTRTNGLAASGYGPVGIFSFIIIDIIDDSKLHSTPYFSVQVDAPTALWADGNSSIGEPILLEIPLRLTPKESVGNEDFLVYPSPARDLVNIHLNGDGFIESLWVYDATGRQVYHSGAVQWEHAELNFGHLPAGFYFATAQTSFGRVVRKFQLMR